MLKFFFEKNAEIFLFRVFLAFAVGEMFIKVAEFQENSPVLTHYCLHACTMMVYLRIVLQKNRVIYSLEEHFKVIFQIIKSTFQRRAPYM